MHALGRFQNHILSLYEVKLKHVIYFITYYHCTFFKFPKPGLFLEDSTSLSQLPNSMTVNLCTAECIAISALQMFALISTKPIHCFGVEFTNQEIQEISRLIRIYSNHFINSPYEIYYIYKNESLFPLVTTSRVH